jgi:hypothetical protein
MSGQRVLSKQLGRAAAGARRWLGRAGRALACGLAWTACGAPVAQVDQAPERITQVAPGVVLVDFGRVAFGNLRLLPPAESRGKITVRLGECLTLGRINRNPPGSVRYAQVAAELSGAAPLLVAPEPDGLNTTKLKAVRTPEAWGVILPFRWAEIEGWPGTLRPEQIRRQASFAKDWREDAAAFHTSDDTLNRIWDLCYYSMKATTFAGVYVDGDRERICYEADAYLSQLGRFYADGDVQMARDTFERLLRHPTWPTEWASHMIFMAYADWMQTGDTNWLARHYAALRPKLQLDRARGDRLLASSKAQQGHDDLVDWPPGERDEYVFTEANTVVNAFHLRALERMAKLAAALHKDADARKYTSLRKDAYGAFQAKFFDPAAGLYRDGEGTRHISAHGNLFPLAFGLVPAEHRARVGRWLNERGMACSVYAAQYLMEGLMENGFDSAALALMTAPGERSWKHMVESGATITWEAWDQRFKPNQDWNHAWGAAPANLLPRYVLGARPLEPGWKRALIRPCPGPLKSAEGRIPAPQGPIEIRWENEASFTLSLRLPAGMSAQVELPAEANADAVLVNGRPAEARRREQRLILDQMIQGEARIEARPAVRKPL